MCTHCMANRTRTPGRSGRYVSLISPFSVDIRGAAVGHCGGRIVFLVGGHLALRLGLPQFLFDLRAVFGRAGGHRGRVGFIAKGVLAIGLGAGQLGADLAGGLRGGGGVGDAPVPIEIPLVLRGGRGDCTWACAWAAPAAARPAQSSRVEVRVFMKRSWQSKHAAGAAAPSSAIRPADDFLDAGNACGSGSRAPVAFLIRPGERGGVARNTRRLRRRYFTLAAEVSARFQRDGLRSAGDDRRPAARRPGLPRRRRGAGGISI